MQAFIRFAGVIAAAVFITGCSGLMLSAERPRFNIANIQPRELKLLEQVFTMDLRIQNPSGSPIDIQGLVFNLEINDVPFASGVSDKHLTIPPFTSRLLQVEAVTTLASLLHQISQAQKSTDAMKLKYRLKGTIHTGSVPARIPFDEAGEISGLQE